MHDAFSEEKHGTRVYAVKPYTQEPFCGGVLRLGCAMPGGGRVLQGLRAGCQDCSTSHGHADV